MDIFGSYKETLHILDNLICELKAEAEANHYTNDKNDKLIEGILLAMGRIQKALVNAEHLHGIYLDNLHIEHRDQDLTLEKEG